MAECKWLRTVRRECLHLGRPAESLWISAKCPVWIGKVRSAPEILQGIVSYLKFHFWKKKSISIKKFNVWIINEADTGTHLRRRPRNSRFSWRFRHHLRIFPAWIPARLPKATCYYSWPKSGVGPTCPSVFRNSNNKQQRELKWIDVSRQSILFLFFAGIKEMMMMNNDDIQMNHLVRCILSGISPHPGHGAVKSQRFLDKSLHVRQLRPLRIPESPAAINSWDFIFLIFKF